MLPSDMLLKPLNQVIEGYNDKIVVNTSGFELGKQSVNIVVKPKPKRRPHTLDDHRDEITSVILALGGLTLFGIWFLK